MKKEDKSYLLEYMNHTKNIIDKLDLDLLYKISHMIETSINKGYNIYTIGNGGSASIASHFATDIVHTLHGNARCLSDGSGLITAIGNDISFEDVFSKQLNTIEMLSSTNGLLIAFSCSGKSPNIIKAIETAYDMAVDSILISGGCPVQELADIHYMVPAINAFSLEGVFSVICHALVSYIRGSDYELPVY